MNNYIKSLKDYLLEKDILKLQVEEIINDYIELYEDYLNSGLNDEEIVLKLGRPNDIYRSLKDTLKKEKESTFGKKLIAASPFISIIIYVLLGYFLKAWHPAWVVFLSTPLFAVFFNRGTLLKRITESSIFIGITLAILLPYFGVLSWKFSWLFFIGFLLLSPFTYNNKTFVKALILEISLILSIILYIVLIILKVSIPIALLSFVITLMTGIYLGFIEIDVDIDFNRGLKKVFIISSFIVSVLAFIILGLIFNNWAYIWQVLLLPFIVSIMVENKKIKYTITSLMPFLSTIIFFNLGYFYNLWAISWLAFLLIPLVAVLEKEPIVKITKYDENQ